MENVSVSVEALTLEQCFVLGSESAKRTLHGNHQEDNLVRKGFFSAANKKQKSEFLRGFSETRTEQWKSLKAAEWLTWALK